MSVPGVPGYGLNREPHQAGDPVFQAAAEVRPNSEGKPLILTSTDTAVYDHHLTDTLRVDPVQPFPVSRPTLFSILENAFASGFGVAPFRSSKDCCFCTVHCVPVFRGLSENLSVA